jgi:prophage regulatory protein
MLRHDEVLSRRARGRTSHWNDVRSGLFTRGVKMGARDLSWPEYEVDVLIKARVAGKSDEEIRALVAKLEAERAKI